MEPLEPDEAPRGRDTAALPAAETRGTRCPHCGAARTRLDTTRCQYCGGVVLALGPEFEGRLGDLAGRFDDLARHPDYAQALRDPPQGRGPLGSSVLGVAVGLGFAGLAATILLGGTGGVGVFVIVPVLLVAAGLHLALRSLRRAGRLATAELERFGAVVVAQRTNVVSMGDDATQTQHFTTLEDRRGARRELATPGRLAGRLREAEMGVAFVRDTHLIDFRRVAL